MRKRLEIADQVLLLLSLVPYLTENGPTHVTDLSARFDVEPRVLRRLLQFLGTAGVPGETHTYQHEDLFDIDWDLLENDDIAHLITPVAVDDAPRFSPSETAALLAGLYSLTTMLGPEDAALAERTAHKLASAFEVDDASMSVTAEPQDPKLLLLLDAIERGTIVTFVYRDASGAVTSRRTAPLRLSQGADTWYLRAWCTQRAGERTFRLDRMSELVLQDALASSEMPAPAVSHTESADGAESVVVTARVAEWALPRIAGFQPEVLEAPAASHHPSLDPGWVRVRVRARVYAAAVHLQQHAPGNIVIESPPEAVAAVRSWADAALAQYHRRNM